MLQQPFPVCHSPLAATLCLLTATLVAGCGSGSGTSSTDIDPALLDDFSNDTTRLEIQDRTSDAANAAFEFANNAATATVTSSGDAREQIRLRVNGPIDTLSSRAAILSGSEFPGAGRAQASMSAEIYNDTVDGGSDGQIGDIGLFLRIEFRGDGDPRFAYGAYRTISTDGLATEDAAILDGESFRTFGDFTPVLDQSYDLTIALDRAAGTASFSVDDQTATFALPTPAFAAAAPFASIGARTDRGPATARVRFDAAGADDYSADFSRPATLARYNTADSGRSGRLISVQDGELRIESASSGDQLDTRFRVSGLESNYIQAQLRLAADSSAANGGIASGRVGGGFYYGIDNPAENDLFGLVFAVSELVLAEDGSTEARYCAWQSDSADFSTAISLTNPDDESGCNRFALVPVLDQNYTISTWLDEASRRLVFTIDDETHELAIETPITFDDAIETRLQARSSGSGSRAVVIADNLRLTP